MRVGGEVSFHLSKPRALPGVAVGSRLVGGSVTFCPRSGFGQSSGFGASLESGTGGSICDLSGDSPLAQVERVLIPGLSGWAASSEARRFRAVWNYRAGSGRIVLLSSLLCGVRWAEVRGQFALRRGIFCVPVEKVRFPRFRGWARVGWGLLRLRGCALPGSVAGQRRLRLDNSVPSGITMRVRAELSEVQNWANCQTGVGRAARVDSPTRGWEIQRLEGDENIGICCVPRLGRCSFPG